MADLVSLLSEPSLTVVWDLTQAEAVMDIIRAKTDKAMNIAVKQLDGSLADPQPTHMRQETSPYRAAELISTILKMTMLK